MLHNSEAEALGSDSRTDDLFRLAELLFDAMQLSDKLTLSEIGIQLSESINECQRAIGVESRKPDSSAGG